MVRALDRANSKRTSALSGITPTITDDDTFDLQFNLHADQNGSDKRIGRGCCQRRIPVDRDR
jgi:hypothetical protein